jgi:hypothetical protein
LGNYAVGAGFCCIGTRLEAEERCRRKRICGGAEETTLGVVEVLNQIFW